MHFIEARVSNYRSILDTGWFEIEKAKTILVGPNEAGKTVLLQALCHLNPPEGTPHVDPLRDYPRSRYNANIQSGAREPSTIPVVQGRFLLDNDDGAEVAGAKPQMVYVRTRFLDNHFEHYVEHSPFDYVYTDALRKDLIRMATHAGTSAADQDHGPLSTLERTTAQWKAGTTRVSGDKALHLRSWLESLTPHVNENDEAEDRRHARLLEYTRLAEQEDDLLENLQQRLPTFVYFDNYSRVRPNVHLEFLANREQARHLDDNRHDYGNLCLLKLLGFTARELSDLGKATAHSDDRTEFEDYRARLDERQTKLNAASLRLTKQIREVWRPDASRGESVTLRVIADGQYLKVVVEDGLGIEIELDQRSEGFQWLVSFYTVFFAEAADRYSNAVLLLDEPGLSLHGLKQREFRATLSQLAETNQSLYTTHSPFLVGPDELDLVRVIEKGDDGGTRVHNDVTATDPGALLPLQEALGYDLAQSLFVQSRNLVLEGLTDYWYLESVAGLLAVAGEAKLDRRIALIPARSAGKVVYFATVLHANKLKVAALLDSDRAGDQAAQQELLVHTLGNKRILRTADVCHTPVSAPEIEDLLPSTLIAVASKEWGKDVSEAALNQPHRPIASLLKAEIGGARFKYRLAKAFVRWSRDNTVDDLTDDERASWTKLIHAINEALR